MASGKSISTPRIILKWAMVVGAIIAVSTVCFCWSYFMTASRGEPQETNDNSVVHAFFYLFLGIIFLVAGLAGYFAAIMTCHFTFDYTRPVWDSVKSKAFAFNILVITALGLGGGFILSALFAPVLNGLGLHGSQASLMPVLAVLIGIQLIQLWVLIWSPVEKRMIVNRLKAQGFQQLQGAVFVGISNPETKLTKQFAAMEEDMGALWVTPDRLAFRGDVEQFDLTRDQVVQIERKAYGRSNTALAGIEHVILHVQLADGSIRQMRLHVEGVWTLGQKRRAMDALGDAIKDWYGQPASPYTAAVPPQLPQ
jgi:hypothetical protein